MFMLKFGRLKGPWYDMCNAVLGLVKLASRSNIYPFYENVKYLICCDGAPPAYDLFVAWTVVGSLAFVLASLCSLRIFLHSGSS
jgi:hypothetical protein